MSGQKAPLHGDYRDPTPKDRSGLIIRAVVVAVIVVVGYLLLKN